MEVKGEEESQRTLCHKTSGIHHITKIETEADLEREEGGQDYRCICNGRSINASMNFASLRFSTSVRASSQSFLFTRLLPDDVVLNVSWSVIWYSSQRAGPLYVFCVCVCVYLLILPLLIVPCDLFGKIFI